MWNDQQYQQSAKPVVRIEAMVAQLAYGSLGSDRHYGLKDPKLPDHYAKRVSLGTSGF
jgi:hypothetical protein